MPKIPADLVGREAIRGWGERVPAVVDYLVQTTHPGTIRLDGDTASGRACMHELGRARDGSGQAGGAGRRREKWNAGVQVCESTPTIGRIVYEISFCRIHHP